MLQLHIKLLILIFEFIEQLLTYLTLEILNKIQFKIQAIHSQLTADLMYVLYYWFAKELNLKYIK